MATTPKTTAGSAAAPAKRVVPVKPSAKLAATPAGRKNAARAAKRKRPDGASGKAGAAAAEVAKPSKAAKASGSSDKAGKASKGGKAAKAPKAKLVRDSFRFPEAEYAVLDTLKERAVKAGKAVKKSELLRAGLKALAALPDLAFRTALDALPARKPRRQAKD